MDIEYNHTDMTTKQPLAQREIGPPADWASGLKSALATEGRVQNVNFVTVTLQMNQTARVMPRNPRRIALIFMPQTGSYGISPNPSLTQQTGITVSQTTGPFIAKWSDTGIWCQLEWYAQASGGVTIQIYEVEILP